MGTNYYWRLPHSEAVTLPTGVGYSAERDRMDPRIHIGKRSAAGRYCWDCDETLLVGGRAAIRHSSTQWDACPRCGKAFVAGVGHSSAMVELGMNAPAATRPMGVSSASSFTWAQEPDTVRTICRDRPSDQLIEDEYGRVLTGQEFLHMLDTNCPIVCTDRVGRSFR